MNDRVAKVLVVKKGLTLIAIVCFVLSQTVPQSFAALTQSEVGGQAKSNQPQRDTLAQKKSSAEAAPETDAIQTPSTIPVLDFLATGTLSDPSAEAEPQTSTALESPEVVSPPTITPPPETVSVRTLTLGGTKAPGQSLWISSNDGKSYTLFVVEDTETTWSASVDLVNGANNFRIVAADTVLNPSDEVAVPTITYRYRMPTPPTVTPPPLAVSDDPWIVLSGIKTAGQSIGVSSNGGRTYTQLVRKNAATTWSGWVQLGKGNNDFTILAKDAIGNPSAAVAVPTITYTMTAPTVTPFSPTVATPTVTLSGSKAPGASLWISSDGGRSDTQLVPNDISTTWSAPVDLVRGDNHFTIVAEDRVGNSSAYVSVPTIRCTAEALPPGNLVEMFIQGPID